MADATQQPDSMYCHGCHHQWQRQGESIECPDCRSASTEIISSDDDPRHFYGRQPQQTAESSSTPSGPEPTPAPAPVYYGPERPPVSPQVSTSAGANQQGPTARGPPPAQFIFAPMTFQFTIISEPRVSIQPHPQQSATAAAATPEDHHQQQQEQPQQQAPQTPHPTSNWFGMHFFTPRFHAPPPPPPTGTNSPPMGSTETVSQGQSQDRPQPESQPQDASAQHQQDQQQRPGVAQGGLPGGFMAALIASLFDPMGPMMFGNLDAVYSQEAFDRIITQLREANANAGGAPPASQSAIDKLQTKEVDDEMLGASEDNKPKCVICVDEMVKGEKASVLPCNHFFHGECVTPWLKQHNTCPVCRRSIEEEAHEKPAKTVDEIDPHGHHHVHENHESAPNATGCM